MALEYFTDARGQLDDALPQWWANEDPSSELYKLLQALADMSDELAAEFEQIYADQALATASDAALREQWAVLYGAGNEQLPTDTETLRAYLQARASEDGSVASLENTLLTLLRNPQNDVDVPGLILDATFRSDGTGLTLGSQFIPERGGYLVFPPDGTGIVLDVAFPVGGRIEIVELPTDNRVDVNVRSVLAFDRDVFARAVARFRLAHNVASVITEF